MPVEFDCTGCRKRLRVPDEVRGQQAKCPHCEEIQFVPADDTPFASWASVSPMDSPAPSEGANPYRDDVPIRQNPYAAPLTSSELLTDAVRRFNLASRGDRFLGMMIDWFFSVLCMVPGMICAGLADSLGSDMLSSIAGFLMLGGVAVYFGIQWYLITVRAQSVGKWAMNTRIITLQGGPPGFVTGVILRNWILGFTCLCYPIGFLITIVDGLVIFGENRQCLHDMIASTLVVKD